MGLTQTEVSSQLGITQSQYSRLEKSESNPTEVSRQTLQNLSL